MMNFKKTTVQWLVCIGAVTLSLSTLSYAAPGQLSQLPLFVSKSTVQPNIFFEIDDSASMDSEITTQPYWLRCLYDSPTRSCSGENIKNDSYFTIFNKKLYPNPAGFMFIYNNADNVWLKTCGSATYGTFRCGTDQTLIQTTLNDDWRIFSAAFNTQYYNPAITYEPWQAGAGTANLPQAVFKSAKSHPNGTITSDLGAEGGFVLENWEDSHGFKKEDSKPIAAKSIANASNRTEGANGMVDYWDKHRRYVVTNDAISYQDISYVFDKTSGLLTTVEGTLTATDKGATGRTLAAEQQNIANWYQYYRRRSFVAKGAVAKVISEYPSYQYGLSMINWSSTSKTIPFFGVNEPNILTDFFNYTPAAANNTPLLIGLNNVGQYFLGNITGKKSPITSECQQNFAILFSDGYWDASSNAKFTSPTGFKKDGDKYEPTLADVAYHYYMTDLSGLPNNVPTSTFDKQTQQHLVTFTISFGLYGKLIGGNNGWPNPALAEASDWGDPIQGGATDIPEKLDDMWHAAYNSKGTFLSANSPQAVSDGFKHIIENIGGRGGGSASGVSFNTNTLTGTTAVYLTQFKSPDVSANSLQKDWIGNILSYKLDGTTGAVSASSTWEAATTITANLESTRKIFTYNRDTKKGIAFKWDDLSKEQKNDLLTNTDGSVDTLTSGSAKAQARLAYLRGNNSNEGAGTTYQFRKRSQLLGDVIHSDPLFVGKPQDSWPAAAPFPVDTKSYSNFVSTKANRQKMVYAGANDGMLHGLNASSADGSGLGTGAEMMAYIPNALFSSGDAMAGLHYLTDPNYSHQYYVDMPTIVGDAYFDTGNGQGAAWHSILLGGYMAGGRGIFALDVTDPTLFSEANAAKIALWEFDSTDDADMGYSFAKPTITMMPNNRWAAIFGNGYNSSGTGSATLFVVFLDGGLDGNWANGSVKTPDYVKITAPTSADKITGANCLNSASDCNGLSSPQAVDSNGDYKVDRVYAGDLRGNLWAFDLSDTDPSKWKVAYETTSGSKKPAPLFTASHHITPTTGTNKTPVQQKLCSSQVCVQQITNKPIVVKNPLVSSGGTNLLVFFGTGQYLKATDPASIDMQSFYGVWDHGVAELTPANLVEQKFLAGPFYNTNGSENKDIRVLSANPILYEKSNTTTNQGWFINLNLANGERVIVDADLRIIDSSNIENNDMIFFNTWIPEAQECTAGGYGYLMSVNMTDGSNPKKAAFDLSKDGTVNDTDLVSVDGVLMAASGRKFTNGLPSSSTIFNDTQYTPGTEGGTKLDPTAVRAGPPMRRISWQELRNN